MGDYAIQALTAVQTTVKNFWGYTDAQAWQHVGITTLIGVNDPETEVLSVDESKEVGNFARSKKAAMISMWAITRDRPCPAGVTATGNGDACAGNADASYAFSKAFLGPDAAG